MILTLLLSSYPLTSSTSYLVANLKGLKIYIYDYTVQGHYFIVVLRADYKYLESEKNKFQWTP